MNPDRLTRPLLCLPSVALALLLIRVLPAQPAATGDIRGRVQNEATGRYLPNARVTVAGTNLTAFTDETGLSG